MNMLDDMQDKAKDMMSDPSMRERVEQYAKEKGCTIEEAKEHFLKRNENDQE